MGLRLPNGSGIAQISANPTGKRVAGGVFLAAAGVFAANLIGYGAALEYEPLVFGGLLVASIAVTVGLSFLIRAGRPRVRWIPGPPPTLPGRAGSGRLR